MFQEKLQADCPFVNCTGDSTIFCGGRRAWMSVYDLNTDLSQSDLQFNLTLDVKASVLPFVKPFMS